MEKIGYRIHKNIDFLIYKEGENPVKTIFQEKMDIMQVFGKTEDLAVRAWRLKVRYPIGLTY